jgi:hypothetical protein
MPRETNQSNPSSNGADPVFQEMWLSELRPAQLNDQIYRPVSTSDPAIRDLAKDIKTNGLIEPPVVTRDHVIISGHRRHAACKIAKVDPITVQIWPILSTDPEFPALLVAANNQRIKTSDEILREEVVESAAAEGEAHRRLIEHRRRNATLEIEEAIQIEGVKRRNKISKAKRPMLDAVLEVLKSYKDFLPVTLRRIHYALLNKPPLKHAGKGEWCMRNGKQVSNRYDNTIQSYKNLSDLLTRARHEGIISWSWIHDPTRPVTTWQCYANVQQFMRRQLDGFLRDYQRDYLQSQPNHIEMVGEKLTLDGVIRPVVAEYGIRVTTGRGYSSYTKLKEMAQRFQKSGKEKLVILFLSDFDPEGEDIPHSFARCMRDDHGIEEENIVPIKVALTGKQVQKMQLPPQMQAKEKSSRKAKFTSKHGENVFELEAVPPVTLQTILRETIDSVLDLDAFNAEIDREGQDSEDLERHRKRAHQALGFIGL